MTLISRKLRGAPVFEPHRTFVFHMVTDTLGCHKTVLIAIMLINVCWLLPMSVFSLFYAADVLYITALAVLPIFVLWFYFRKKLFDESVA